MNFIILYILVGLFAYDQALYDSKLMPSFKSLYRKKVKHWLAWIYRFGFVAGLLTLIGFNVFMFISLGFYFSLIFRLSLNKLRNADWDYISNSNWYDSVFLKVSQKYGGKIVFGFELIMFGLGLFKFLN